MNPYKARLAKAKKRPPPGEGLSETLRIVWEALSEACDIIDSTENKDLKLRAINSIFTGAQVYAKMLAGEEFEARLAALEEGAKCTARKSKKG